MALRAAVSMAVACALFGAAGCGETGEANAGATVTAYVEGQLCDGAQRTLAAADGRAGELRVRAVCLGGGNDEVAGLAATGAGARRASEDATAIGFLEPPVSPSFSRPIVEAAGIPVVRAEAGAAAMDDLLAAIRGADRGSLRSSVREGLG